MKPSGPRQGVPAMYFHNLQDILLASGAALYFLGFLFAIEVALGRLVY
jgi:hypothetical protein